MRRVFSGRSSSQSDAPGAEKSRNQDASPDICGLTFRHSEFLADDHLIFVPDVVLFAVGEALEAPGDREAGVTFPVQGHRAFAGDRVVLFPLSFASLFADYFADVDTEGQGEAALPFGGAS